MSPLHTPSHTNHTAPLIDSLDALAALHSGIEVRTGSLPVGDGWIAAQSLRQPESPHLARCLERIGALSGTQDRRIWVSFFINSYAWAVAGVSVGCYIVSRRVPDLAPSNVSLRFDDSGWVAGISVTGSRFWALPDDRAAGHPDAILVDDRSALRAMLRHQLEAHMQELIPVLRACSSFGTRALWITVADRCAGFLVWLQQQRPDLLTRETLIRETDALVRVPGSPFNNRLTRVCTQPDSANGTPRLQRGACCLNYRRDEAGYCAGCPIMAVGEYSVTPS